MFKYSPREGTKAATMPNQLDGTVKDKRSKALIELNDKNEGDFTRFIVGRVMDVLIEQPVKGKDDVYEGYTRNYVKVEVKGIEENLKGQIVNCKIEEALGDYAVATLVK